MELPHACEMMRTVLETHESELKYRPSVREYTIDYESDGSVQTIEYCPFCGAKLPDSLYDAWIARLDELGIEPFSDDVPPEMQDDRWWRS